VQVSNGNVNGSVLTTPEPVSEVEVGQSSAPCHLSCCLVHVLTCTQASDEGTETAADSREPLAEQ
jgi:hypothetical protein